ncbi:electron transport complex subunit RsxC [Thauera sp. CAU 1555]|uniref:Ion-translocating oxidoreductase complex subunit C n=1 Tax=Thauera sedimentorum TaxID=2767595 RepID=A0ABR9BDC8_9RHOO|nr:electron transport complex subunit RsxC [Thauera sedimentorum]MBC9073010.1 electron transport complex subunit RsxC [Thauera sedimentorum]MBD8503929.1 electron transport complex subunit RsxC [Thauera sedimentorum]
MGAPDISLLTRLTRLVKRWGAHPDGRKDPAAGTETTAIPLPPLLTLPLTQHIGAPARPLVSAGERVLRGQLIAEAAGPVSAPLHAPTSGTILGIGEVQVPHPSGLTGPAILLESDGLDEAVAFTGANPFTLEPAEIARRVAAAGIVGLGGATFPAAVKLSLGQRTPIPTLILNGGECEPYLSCDDRLMQERAGEVIDGARIILRAIGGSRVLIGVESNKPQAIAALREAAAGFGEVAVVTVPSRYPMGSEKQLIAWLTGREVPSQGRSADIGVVVHNVGTAAAIHRAIRYGEPLTRRIVTVAGGAVRTPRNLEVRLGTPASALVAFCGGLTETPARLVMGGPMMGIAVTTLELPIIKGSGGVLALTAAETGARQAAEGPCIRCASCVGACPIGLLPLEMAARIRAGDLAASVDLGLKDCIGCGTCSFVCPSKIPLVQYFNHAKGELAARDRNKLKQDAIRELVEARNERMEREAREKAEAAARRKAERERAKAEAAAKAAAAAAEQPASEESAA